MRNKFAGKCYRCGEVVEAGKGHFERIFSNQNKWRVQHADCAIKYRGDKSPLQIQIKEQKRKKYEEGL